MENNSTGLRVGILGSAVVGICCFTPLLVVALPVIGLSAWLGWLDYVLFPALAFFVGLTVYAVWRRKASRDT